MSFSPIFRALLRVALLLPVLVSVDANADARGTPGDLILRDGFEAGANLAPLVDAGPDQSLALEPGPRLAVSTLAGSASDDGQPAGSALRTRWSVVSAPPGVRMGFDPGGPGGNTPGIDLLAPTVRFGEPGSYLLRLDASDGALTASDTVTVTVAPAPNAPPVLGPLPARTLPIGTPLDLVLQATDPNSGDVLTWTLVSGPAGATVDASSGRLRYPAGTLGAFPFTVRVADAAGAHAQGSFTLTVVAANRPPRIDGPARMHFPIGVERTIPVALSDPDGDAPLTLQLLAGPPGLTVVGHALRWTAGAPLAGTTVAKLRVRDPSGASDDALIEVMVRINAAPIARNDFHEVTLGQTLNVAAPGVLANDTEPDGEAMVAIDVGPPSAGTLNQFAASGGFSYTAPAAMPPPAFAMAPRWIKFDFDTWFTPLVARLSGSPAPEIVSLRLNQFPITLNGHDGSERGDWPFPAACPGAWLDHGPMALALGNVDDDAGNTIEIVRNCDGVRMMAYGANGAVRWISPSTMAHPWLTSNIDYLRSRSPTLARLDAQGGVKVFMPLVIRHSYDPSLGTNDGCWKFSGLDEHRQKACFGLVQIDGATGAIERRLVVRWPLDPWSFSQNLNDYVAVWGTVSVADLDGDGVVEIIGGPAVWNNDGSLRWSVPLQAADTAVADLDGDGAAEVVMITSTPGQSALTARQVRVYERDGQLRWNFVFSDPGSNPNVPGMRTRLALADIDGDEVAEVIVLSNATAFVFDRNGRIRWTRTFRTDPLSDPGFSHYTHAQVFDLDNNAIPEVVLFNGDHLWVLAGPDGRVLARWEIRRDPPTAYSTVTAARPYMTPQIADVDADGHADILFYQQPLSAVITEPSMMVISGADNDWAPAPRIWNQHAYRGSTVDDNGRILFDGTVPKSFRQQRRIATPVPGSDPDAVTIPYVADDGSDASAPANVVIRLARANRPPRITSAQPPGTWPLGTNYDWTFTAVDPDVGDTLTWTRDTGCAGAFTPSGNTARAFFWNGQSECTAVVTVTDSQGATASQVYAARQTSETASVPNVTGQLLQPAEIALIALNLRLGAIQRIHAPQLAGSVIAQSPAPGLVRPVLTPVDLTVSLGPEPVIVPNLVGRAEPAALAELAGLRLSGTVSRVLSSSAPAGAVLAQSPAPGTELIPLPANVVALTVSAGNGLRLALDRSAVVAGTPIAVTVIARNANGTPAPLPPLTWTITPRYTPTLGTAPTFGAGTITVPASTRGAYRLVATDTAGGRSASIDFAVLAPAAPGIDGATAEHAKLLQVLDGIAAIGRQMEASLAANDEAAMRQQIIALVTLWRTIDPDDLRMAPPVVLNQGFVPTLAQMAGFGVSPGPDDRLNLEILDRAAADLDAFTRGLRGTSTPMGVLRQQADAFNASAARLSTMSVSEWGTVAAYPHYALLLQHRIPAFFEALTNELAPVVNLPRRAPKFPFGGDPLPAMAPKAGAKSSLAELTVTMAVQFTVDKIMDKGSEIVGNAKQFARDLMGQAAYSAAVLAATSHLREFVQGQDIEETVSGASLSFRVFGPPAFIEVFSNDERELNEVMIIGPTLLANTGQSINALLQGIKNAYSYGLDPANNPARCRNANECYDKVKKLREAIEENLVNPTNNLFKVAESFFQRPTRVTRGCVFAPTAPGCVQLHYDDGFKSVYQYAPPAGLGPYSGLPVPIVIIVQDQLTGLMYFGTPSFLPSPPDPEP
jgi:hypothetical protein